jgi:hypothetical protein
MEINDKKCANNDERDLDVHTKWSRKFMTPQKSLKHAIYIDFTAQTSDNSINSSCVISCNLSNIIVRVSCYDIQ